MLPKPLNIWASARHHAPAESAMTAPETKPVELPPGLPELGTPDQAGKYLQPLRRGGDAAVLCGERGMEWCRCTGVAGARCEKPPKVLRRFKVPTLGMSNRRFTPNPRTPESIATDSWRRIDVAGGYTFQNDHRNAWLTIRSPLQRSAGGVEWAMSHGATSSEA